VDETFLVLAVSFGLTFVLAILFILVLRYQYDPASRAMAAEIRRTQEPLACFYAVARLDVSQVNGASFRWKYFILTARPDDVTIHPRKKRNTAPFAFTPDQIRWFGRPQKYSAGRNELWLHLEMGGGWHLVKFQLYEGLMRDLVRALKAVSSEELVTAYRRRRPYIHAGPATGQPADQDIHGAWTLDGPPVTLYLMPRFLVILHETRVLRKIPLETVQQIGAFRRLDEPSANGLVRFRAEEETLAFALDQHEDFALALAEAAKRTLEAPIMQKQKKKDDDEFDDDDVE
jgi:hypothetical protein